MGFSGNRNQLEMVGRPLGFSLLELMITVAVLAILVTLATPAFTSIINSNRLTAGSNALLATMQYARSEAVRRNARVSVCPTGDGSTCEASGNWQNWITRVDADGEVLRAGGVKAPLQLTSAIERIEFRSDGLARDPAGLLLAGDFTTCIATDKPPENQRVLTIASGSRLSTESVNGSGACP